MSKINTSDSLYSLFVKGYFKVPRELFETAIWLNSTAEQKVVLIAIIMMVNHSPAEWEWKGRVYKVLPGQMITSLNSIAAACGKGISVQNVRTAISRFEKLGILTDESTNDGRLITLDLSRFASDTKSNVNNEFNRQPTDSQQSPNIQSTSNNNINNNKINDNEENTIEICSSLASSTLADKIIECFKQAHLAAHNLEYIITNYSKEKAAAEKIAQLYILKNGETDDQEMLNNLYPYFLQCLNINNDWLRKNMSLSIMISKTNEINKIFKYGNVKQGGISNTQEARGIYDAILKGIEISGNNNAK